MPNKPNLGLDDLAQLSATTIAHYDNSAESFWRGTKDHDVTQNHEALLRHITDAKPPFRILDLGCGPGRDLIAFRDAGHEPTGLDAASNFCALARELSGCPVLHQNMLALDLPAERFDGVFANAVLFHVPTQELPRVLGDLRGVLKTRGVLFASNPRGDNQEGWSGDRYGAYHDYERWTQLVTTAGFEELEHYYRPSGKPREEQPWLATVYRKI
jgi:SAM-dependent methyltransferase